MNVMNMQKVGRRAICGLFYVCG